MTFELLDKDGSVIPSGRGGARAGAGRKPNNYVKPTTTVDYETARARKEAALADLNELDYKIKSGQYVSRQAVRQASATVLAHLAQTIRSLPDNLERRGVAPSVCATIDAAITEVLSDVQTDLARLYESAEDDLPDDNSDLFR